MFKFPVEFSEIMIQFQSLFSKRTYAHAQMMLVGAILSPGKRTVTSVLRIMGLSEEKNFPKYHRVLSLFFHLLYIIFLLFKAFQPL